MSESRHFVMGHTQVLECTIKIVGGDEFSETLVVPCTDMDMREIRRKLSSRVDVPLDDIIDIHISWRPLFSVHHK